MKMRLLVTTISTLLITGLGGGLASAQDASSCTQFASQAEAQGAHAANPGGGAGLDEDGDGVACEDVIYSNLATDFTPVGRIGAASVTPAQQSGSSGIGASGITPTQESSDRVIGASGTVPAAPQASETAAGGIGAAGTTPAPGVGAAGTTGGQRASVAGSMTGMPSTGTGAVGSDAWLVPAAVLLGALGAGWMAVQSRRIAGATRSA